jgi:hypothetical protein
MAWLVCGVCCASNQPTTHMGAPCHGRCCAVQVHETCFHAMVKCDLSLRPAPHTASHTVECKLFTLPCSLPLLPPPHTHPTPHTR